MPEQTTRADIAAKIDWEGGIWDALEYGLKTDDMPDGDTELRSAWADLRSAFAVAEEAAGRVDALLPDEDEESSDG